MALAGTPDDASEVDVRLTEIARLAAETLPPVSYASTTALRDGSYTTVAASNPLAAAVDDAQYDDGAGPCLTALETGQPVAVHDVALTMRWPEFRRVAQQIGLHSSLSIPLFAGSGEAVASMNLYGHDQRAMTSLGQHVRAAFQVEPTPSAASTPRKHTSGTADLAAGVVKALAVRDQIQRAIGMVSGRQRCSTRDAYLSLRVRAAETGVSLPDIAISTLQRLA
ncbi:GAF and ANTAR domain-containing protein [Cryptosporangium sp. NPDC048952]|uniref:GAF and ANTAR domain-containing protein n=1 Tax=Cryptosporangium sp. NPDC048952 TaxID=3363961 RepID=UPI0037150E1E